MSTYCFDTFSSSLSAPFMALTVATSFGLTPSDTALPTDPGLNWAKE